MFDVNNIQDPGARHTEDARDYKHSDLVAAPAPFNWTQGFDCEKAFNIKIPFKNQMSSSSCVGQGTAYLAAVINTKITGKYDEVSAKAIYSQIFQPGGGAELRDAGLLVTKWGEVLENIVNSHKPDGTTDEQWMEDRSWITPAIVQMAKNLQAKTLVSINPDMESIAQAIRDYGGVILAVKGENNGTWSSNEPQPPVNFTWEHCLFMGKAGKDPKSEFIASPNSWGARNEIDPLHPDDWQKFRANWFTNGNVFAVFTLIDNNIKPMDYSPKLLQIVGTKICGYFTPAQTEMELKDQANQLGIALPEKIGGLDWSQIKIDGKAQL